MGGNARTFLSKTNDFMKFGWLSETRSHQSQYFLKGAQQKACDISGSGDRPHFQIEHKQPRYFVKGGQPQVAGISGWFDRPHSEIFDTEH
jgi:hypothetical protein